LSGADTKGDPMRYVIMVEDPPDLRGQFLEYYDPDYVPDGPSYPSGLATFTYTLDRAMRFKNLIEALDLWGRQSATVPTRPDGRPNRPLAAYTITVVPVE